MKQTEQNKQIGAARQAAGVVFSTAAGKAYAAIMRRVDGGVEQTYRAAFDLADGTERIVRQVRQQAGDEQMPVIAGMDAAQLRFITMSLPPATPEQLPQLIRTQAEARLPLDGDRMRLAWRLSPGPQGYDCTAVAARRNAAYTTLEPLGQSGQLAALVPDASGFVRLCRRYCASIPDVCAALRARPDGLELVLLDGAELMWCAVVYAEPTGVVMQDVLMELEAIRQKVQRKVPIFLWPGQEAMMRPVATGLREAGWETAALEPNQTAMTQAKLEIEADACGSQLDAAGLALAGLSETPPAFDFLQAQRLAQPAEDIRQRRKKIIQSLAATAALAMACAAVGYGSLALEVRQLRRELAAEVDGVKAATILQRHAYQEATARARLDILELVQAIQDARDGLLLDSIEFEQGRPVRLTASAGGYEQVYGFQKRLQAQDGVTDVRLIDPRLDERTQQVRFALQFHYKHYTR